MLSFLFFASAGGFAAAQDMEKPIANTAVAEDPGLAEWNQIYSVLSHPRCANCHAPDDRPRWPGANLTVARLHAFNVQRGNDGSGFGNPGLRCTTCHMTKNSSVLHGPPGAEGWHMAPAEMVWFDRTSPDICAQIKDPARNGGRSLAEVAQHVLDDKLVAWGWAPGIGREPAPFSATEISQAIKRWMASGAPCPSS